MILPFEAYNDGCAVVDLLLNGVGPDLSWAVWLDDILRVLNDLVNGWISCCGPSTSMCWTTFWCVFELDESSLSLWITGGRSVVRRFLHGGGREVAEGEV